MNFPLAGLFVLADDDPRWSPDPVAQARAACAGGAAVVQLRAKHATDRVVLTWAREIRDLTREAGVGFFVNDRFDLALLAEADGVHLGQDDLAPDRLPAEARSRLLVGRSTHDEAELARAAAEPVDYVAFGPVFGTASKDSPYTQRGLEALRSAAARVAPKPMIAIGGVGEAEAGAVAASGAAGFAVISAVAGAADPQAATRRLVEAFGCVHASGTTPLGGSR
ncbi:MAG: thiamine phosphate synthase [bacterium]|nr:thiamine phosphate synthase [bacterium]